MNTVICDAPSKSGKAGSIWQTDDQFFILAEVNFKEYTLIGLKDGNRWRKPTPCVADAIEGTTFVTNNAVITITSDE